MIYLNILIGISNNYEISVMLSFLLNSSKYGSVKILNEKVKKFEEKKLIFLNLFIMVFLSKNSTLIKLN